MKPLNKRTPISQKIADHLKKTSEEKLIPEDQWQSLKQAVKDATPTEETTV